jgi:cephalosporin hydroxylase
MALKATRSLEAGVVMEIGSRYGGTLFAWSRIARKDAFLLSLDWHRQDDERQMQAILSSRVLPTQNFHCVWGNSHSVEIKNAVRETLEGRMLDLLFIDGDHSYEGVKEDFETYSAFVRPGGAILFHDIVPNSHFKDYGVDQLWREISPRFEKRFEFIDRIHPGRGAGVGLLFIP